MPRAVRHQKDETFNFRIDPVLKAAFAAATRDDDKPAAQVLREFMRAYVLRKERRIFDVEAHRQSLAIAKRSLDPDSDDHASLRELGALFDADHMVGEEDE